jgi:hypothetical protein
MGCVGQYATDFHLHVRKWRFRFVGYCWALRCFLYPSRNLKQLTEVLAAKFLNVPPVIAVYDYEDLLCSKMPSGPAYVGYPT